MKECFDVEEFYLDYLQFEQKAATFYLKNGFQLKGHLKHYDDQVLIIEANGKQQMVYKAAVSTIMPTHSVAFPETY